MSNSGISIGPSKGRALSIWHHRQNGSIKRKVNHEELGHFMRRKTRFFIFYLGGMAEKIENLQLFCCLPKSTI
jgi:hypothetical protein